jgi:hypothetical protein
MYDSGKGRWFALDPARQYWSPYVGMGNNPVSLVDPDGRFSTRSEARQFMRDENIGGIFNIRSTSTGDFYIKDGQTSWYYGYGIKGGFLASVNFMSGAASGQGGRDWFNTANNVNTGIGVGTGVLGGSYGLNANQTFKYGVRQGGKIIPASQRTAIHFSHSMKVAGALGRANIITGTAGTVYSGYQAVVDYQEGGLSGVNPWDVSDALLGAGGVAVGGLAMFGIVSNPVGWGVGIGVGLYFGGRLIYDLATTKH